MLALTAVAFGLAWWLGLYLIARDPGKPVLRRAAYGLISYSLAVACHGLAAAAPAEARTALTALATVLVHLSGVAWAGVLLRLAPETADWRDRLDLWWRRAAAPLTVAVLVGAALTAAVGGPAGWTALASLLVVAQLATGFGVLLWSRRATRPAPVVGVLAAATLLFGLGLSGLLLPLGWLPDWLAVAGIGADLAILGLVVAVLDAFSEGETLRPDMWRSAITATAAAALFGGQIGFAMLISGGGSPLLAALLLGSVAAAIAVQVLANPLHRALDRLSLASSGLRAERAQLRDVSDALPRRDPGSRLADMDAEEFGRLTRRALSHYGDLGRLVTSPLTDLPLIEHRLARGDAAGPAALSPVERATELKALLLESITRLKPPDGEVGFSDEWRHYNALYFPYVMGLRPYSQRARHAGLDATARQALRWFQTHVPERTLHNWQNAAAKLVADDLWARSRQDA